MLQKLQNRKESGFTIIEVLIVLAIAALILLIVFLAVPALERSQRNNGRKNDASRISTAVGDFVSNNNGALPAVSADCTTIENDAGSLSQYKSLTCAAGAGPAVAGDLYIYTGAAAVTPPANFTTNAVVLVPGAVCSTTGGTTTTTGAVPTDMAELYDVETTGSWTWACIEAQ